MVARPDGTGECDRCGWPLPAIGVLYASIVSELDAESPGGARTLHYCRDHTDDQGRAVPGCARLLRTPDMLTHRDKQPKPPRDLTPHPPSKPQPE